MGISSNSGVRYIQEIQIEVCHNDSGIFPDHARGSLKQVFVQLCKGVGFNDLAQMPGIVDSIVYETDGTSLSTIVGTNFRKAVNSNKM